MDAFAYKRDHTRLCTFPEDREFTKAKTGHAYNQPHNARTSNRNKQLDNAVMYGSPLVPL